MRKAIFILILLTSLAIQSQNKYVQKAYNLDSLIGFDESEIKAIARSENVFGEEYKYFVSKAKRSFIDKKYNLSILSSTTSKLNSPNNQIMAACTNMGFESGNLSGWTLTNGNNANSNTMGGCCPGGGGVTTVVVDSGTDPITGVALNSPFAGNFICKINDNNTGAVVERISQTFNVTPANSLVLFAYLATLQSAGHNCSAQPFLNVRLLDCSNNVIACPQAQIIAPSGSCPSASPGFFGGPGYSYNNAWQVRSLDLSPFVGSCVTMEVTVGDCTAGGHYGYSYFDSECLPMNITVNNIQFPITSNANNVSACGVANATVSAPPSLGPYVWNGPLGSGISNYTNQTFTTSISGNYTISMNPYGACAPIIRVVNLQFVPNPIANYSFSMTPCDNTKTVSVVSTSSLNGGSPISNYSWAWGDSSPNSVSSATTHTYSSSGIYSVTLNVINTSGCSNAITQTVSITQKPTANFSVASVCSGIAPNFVNLSSTPSGINSYTWNFGNASPLNYSASPSYSYPVSGNYSVTLFVTNTDGCSDVISKSLSIYGRAVPNFSVPSVCFNSASVFTDLSLTTVNPNTSSIISWVWSYGGSGVGSYTVPNPSYTYNTVSNQTLNTVYTPTLFITTANGCKDSLSLPVTVYSLPSPNFVSDSVCLTKGTTLMDVSNSNGNPFSLFSWDFNNDAIVDLSNTSLSTTTVLPNYGNTLVSYTVFTNPTGTLNCLAAITKTVWVHPLPITLITNTNTCIDTQPSNMSGATSSIAIGSISNYAWDYGNGNTSLTNTLAPTSFSYNTAGNYIVTLTLTSNAGCTTVNSKTIEVWEKPYASFHYSKTCLGKTTTITAQPLPVSGVVTTYNWDLNNTPFTIETTGVQISNTFASAGTQTVHMILTTNKGCKNTIKGNLYINYNPKPNFTSPKRSGCTDLYVNLKDSSATITGPSKNDLWEWYFGNEQVTFLPNNSSNTVIYTNSSYTSNKTYDVKLILRTDSGCVDSIKKPGYITVYPNPKADFEWQGISGDILTPQIEFTNTSIGYSKFGWFFNDINVIDSIKNNPLHYFDVDVPRKFNVFLAVRSPYGCKDTTSKYIDIGPEFTFYIPNAFTPNDDGINDFFTGQGIGIKTYDMWIFDRWGEKIFHTNDLKIGWDGSVKGKKVETKTDVYQYKVVVFDLQNKQHEFVGHVTLYK